MAPLLDLGKVRPDISKLFVVGSIRAGKTTFTRAVSGQGDAFNVVERTAGIDIVEVELENVGRVKMHDLAGHDIFHTAHGFFIGGVSATYAYIVDTDLPREKMEKDAIHWLAFIYCGRSPNDPPAHILILGSRGGGKDQKTRQFMLDSVTRKIRKMFAGRFIFILEDKSLVLDMRQADSEVMKEVKKHLAIGVQRCLEVTH